MGWVRIDDSFYDHQKFARVGALGMAAWIAGLAYCNRNLTDGFIPARAARRLIDTAGLGYYTGSMSGRDAESEDGCDELVAAGLWTEDDGGYRIHDYLDYQPSAETVKADRAKARDRMQKARSGGSSGEQPPKFGRNTGRSSATPNPNPTPTAAAAAVAPQQPEIAHLIDRLAEVKLSARWDKLTDDDVQEVLDLLDTHGTAALVRAAQSSHIPDRPAVFAKAWLKSWRALPTRPRAVHDRCDVHHQDQPCGGCAADRKAAG